MGYSFILTNKLKTEADFLETEQELYGTQTGCLMERFCSNALALPWHQGKRRTAVRSNAVKAVLLSCAYFDDPSVDFQKWTDTCRNWINGKFLITEATLLAWETKRIENGGYAYAVIMPVTPEGKISYYYYFNNRQAFLESVDSYAKTMQSLYHLSPPTRNTINAALHKEKKVFKQELVGILPEPNTGESAENYYLRIKDIFLDHYISSENSQWSSLKKLKERNERLEKELFPLYELTKLYGSPAKWESMMLTAQKLQYAVRSYQSKGDQEGLQEISKILKVGEDYIREHSGKK